MSQSGPKDIQPLTVIPSTGLSVGNAKCHLGPKLLGQLDLQLGNCVVVSTDCCSVVCSAWVRRDRAEGYIEFDPTITVNNIHTNSDKDTPTPCVRCLNQNSVRQNKISPQHIYKFKHGTVTSVTVTLVLEDYKDVNKHRKEMSDCEIKAKVYSILRKLFIVKGAVIRSRQLNLGKLYGICHIVVSDATCNKKVGLVTKDADIVVTDIISEDRFRQRFSHNKQKYKLGGLDREFDVLSDIITLPGRYPSAQQESGVQFTRGVLLRGPPGCGKTCLVRWAAMETDSYLEYVNSAALCASRPGEGEEKLWTLFNKSKIIAEDGPCVLFIDEIDVLCPQRGSKGSGAQERRLASQLMSLLDDLHDYNGNLIVVGATNRSQSVDPALRRPGRLEKEIFIGIPRMDQRLSILKVLCDETTIGSDVILEHLAEATPGYTGADLASMVRQATYGAYRRAIDKSKISVTRSDLELALHNTIPSTQRGSDILVDHKPVSWEEIGGLDSVKQQLKQAIEWPLKHPDAFARLGIPRPRGVLLYGPPGCAKTTLVRAAATSCHVTFLAISGAQLFSPFVGDSEKKLAEVFQQARSGAPCILFVDEIEALVGKRSFEGKRKGAQERVLSTLLNEMDGIGVKSDEMQQQRKQPMIAEGESVENREQADDTSVLVDNSDVLLVAATNRPDLVDDALLRPGRIDRLIYVPPPDTEARRKIFEVYLQKMPLEGVDMDELAELTEGYTGADIENLCREAALCALTVDGLDVQRVHHHHFTRCLQSMSPSLTSEEMLMYAKLRKR